MYELYITNKGIIYRPEIEGVVTWETSISSSPGKLTFTAVNDKVLDYQEGNEVLFQKSKDGVFEEGIFFGFVFEKSRDKNQLIKTTSYDQLRYLKNSDTMVYENKRADQVLGMVAKQNNLQVGNVENTGYVIPERIEDNKTYFDIIQNALDLTLINKKKLYILYDDFSKLTLKDVEKMKVDNLVIGEYTAENYDYVTEIDSDTYNQIKLYRENKETKKREIFIAKDSSSINNWGLLQLYESVNEGTNPQEKASALLTLKNRKKRTLKLKNVIGDLRCRAGASVMILIRDIGDISIKQYMLIDSATHRFTKDTHFMDLELRGDI